MGIGIFSYSNIFLGGFIMATNKIDYDVLQQASTSYNTEASAIADVISKLDSMNATLSDGVQN